jgi:hypothetical protein
MILTGENWRTQRKTCSSATLSTTNPIWLDPGANPGLRDDRPATNRLSHGAGGDTLLSEERVAGNRMARTLTNNERITKATLTDVYDAKRLIFNLDYVEHWKDYDRLLHMEAT